MDIQTITPVNILNTPPVTPPILAAPAATDTTAAAAVPTPDPTPAFDVTLSTVTAAATTAADTTATDTIDLNAADIAAQIDQAALAQETVLAAMKSGADVTTLLSGLPPGATATLLGGGMVRTPAGVNPAELEAQWAFNFPFSNLDVPAVTSSTQPEPTRDKEQHGSAGSPLTGYGPRGEKEPMPGLLPPASTLDILD